jgi:hypothetical protein
LNTLYATIKRQPLANILDGSKTIEYREIGDFWFSRLEKAGPPPFLLRMVNGMSKQVPEATARVERLDVDLLDGLIRFHLAGVVEQRNWDPAWAAEFPPQPPDAPLDPLAIERADFVESEIVLEVPPEVLERLAATGQTRFSLPLEEQTYADFAAAPGGWMIVRLRSGEQTAAAGLIEALDRFYEPVVDYWAVRW